MSTRTSLLCTTLVHVFRDMRDDHIYVDFGRGAYNRAWKVWPPTLRRLY